MSEGMRSARYGLMFERRTGSRGIEPLLSFVVQPESARDFSHQIRRENRAGIGTPEKSLNIPVSGAGGDPFRSVEAKKRRPTRQVLPIATRRIL
jgi:hypothetical protein